jgi:hypothetical protein
VNAFRCCYGFTILLNILRGTSDVTVTVTVILPIGQVFLHIPQLNNHREIESVA